MHSEDRAVTIGTLSLFKSFTFNEARGSRLELRLETFNAWNHTQFNQTSNTSAPVTSASSRVPSIREFFSSVERFTSRVS